MINITICDDCEIIAEDLADKIREVNLKEEHTITVCFTARALIKHIKEERCDILFMDIELEDNIKGTDVAIRIKELYPEMLIIYISGYDIYYEKMVQAESFRFLEKPFKKEKVEAVLMPAISRHKRYEYVYKYNWETHTVDLKEVVYMYSQERKIYFHLKDKSEICFYGKLDDVEMEINRICNFFLRINQSYIANINFVHMFKSNKFYMNDNTILSISRGYRKNATDKYAENILEKFRP